MKRFVRSMVVCLLSAAFIGCGSPGGDDDDPPPGGDDPGTGTFTVQGYEAQSLTKAWTELDEGNLDLYLYSETPDNASPQDFVNLTLNTSSLAAGTYSTADGSLMSGTAGVDYTATAMTYTFLGDLDNLAEEGASTLTVAVSGSTYTLSYTLYVNPVDDAETVVTVTGTYSGPLQNLE